MGLFHIQKVMKLIEQKVLSKFVKTHGPSVFEWLPRCDGAIFWECRLNDLDRPHQVKLLFYHPDDMTFTAKFEDEKMEQISIFDLTNFKMAKTLVA